MILVKKLNESMNRNRKQGNDRAHGTGSFNGCGEYKFGVNFRVWGQKASKEWAGQKERLERKMDPFLNKL